MPAASSGLLRPWNPMAAVPSPVSQWPPKSLCDACFLLDGVSSQTSGSGLCGPCTAALTQTLLQLSRAVLWPLYCGSGPCAWRKMNL